MPHEQGYMFGKSENSRLDHVCLPRCDVMYSDHASRTKSVASGNSRARRAQPHLFRGSHCNKIVLEITRVVARGSGGLELEASARDGHQRVSMMQCH
jgi:hypothetical protein